MIEKIKVLVVADNDEIRYELKTLLGDEDIAVVAYTRTGASVLDKVASLAPEVVVMMSEKNAVDHAEIAERIYINIPNCLVLLLMENPDIRAIEDAMQAGVRKVIAWPCTPKALVDHIKLLSSIEKIRSSNNKQKRVNWESKVITVFGTKGGIGKSTVSVNLAVSLARLGKKVALIDLDLQFGDIGVFMDLEPKETIAELAQDKTTFEIDTIKSFMVLHNSGVSVLAAPKSPEYAEIVTAEHIEKIINTIRPYFDYVIIDTPPAFNDSTLVAIDNSNFVLFVITLEISTLRNAKISSEVFSTLNQRDKLRMMVNRDQSGGISVKDAEKVLGGQIYHKLISDWKTAISALNKGIPIVLDAPGSELSRQFVQLAKKVESTK
jgi:pilus assembly protein CpaE